MEEITFAIVGTNFVTDMFMTGLNELDGVKVIAVCSKREESLKIFSEKYPGIPGYLDYKELVTLENLDAVYLAVPNFLHHEMSMFFMNNGIAVFCEKPLGVNPTQVREMIACSRKNKVLLHDGIVPMYARNFWELKERLSEIGPIRRCVFTQGKYSSRYDAYLRGENPPTFCIEYGNGSLMDMGVYCVAAALGLFGKPHKIISNAEKLPNGIDCLGSALFMYDGFEIVLLHSKVTNTAILSEIQGENGLIQIDHLSRMNEISMQKGSDEKVRLGAPRLNGFTDQLHEFIKNFRLGNYESEMVGHQFSLDLAEVLFELRQQNDIHFPLYGE